jgi:hypothetical protein
MIVLPEQTPPAPRAFFEAGKEKQTEFVLHLILFY